jgi:hypothetical protein
MDRRKFLKGSAGLVAGTASGGAGNVARAAGVAGVALDRIARVYETVAKTEGGYPHDTIKDIQGLISEISSGDLSGLIARIQGAAGISVYKKEDEPKFSDDDSPNIRRFYRTALLAHEPGKIYFGNEARLLSKLTTLPINLPVLDLLDERILDGFNSGDNAYENPEDNPKIKKARALREALEPLCHADTTPADLIAGLKPYFVGLGQHAVHTPGDFTMGSNRWFNPVIDYTPLNEYFYDKFAQVIDSKLQVSGSSLKDLLRILEYYQRTDTDLVPITEAINRHLDDYITKERARNLASDKKMQEAHRKTMDQLMKKAEQRAEERRADPSLRAAYKIGLLPAGENCYVVQKNTAGAPVPKRIDWVQWIQKIDPENARICDVDLDGNDLIITFKNKAALNFLRAASGNPSTGHIEVSLLNQRPGIDLNDYEETTGPLNILMIDEALREEFDAAPSKSNRPGYHGPA